MSEIIKRACDQCSTETVETDTNRLPENWVRIEGTITVFGKDEKRESSVDDPLDFCGRYCLGCYVDGLRDKLFEPIPAEVPEPPAMPMPYATPTEDDMPL